MNYEYLSDEYFMNEALREALKAFEEDEVPVGAVIVAGNTVIARGHNLTETLTDVTARRPRRVVKTKSWPAVEGGLPPAWGIGSDKYWFATPPPWG